MFTRTSLAALLLTVLLGFTLSACSTAEEDSFAGLETTFHKGKVYTATLNELNNSGASGEARVSFKGNSLTVDLQATGLLADAVHLSHIHGFAMASEQAACPTLDNDTNGDGLVDLGEGAPVYGGILVTLGDDVGSTIMDEAPYRTFDETDSGDSIASIMPLNKKHIVIHGVDVNGNGTLDDFFEVTMPALCGAIEVN